MHSCFFFRKVTLSQERFPCAFLEFPKVRPQTSKKNHVSYSIAEAHYRVSTNLFFFLKKNDFT